MPYICIYILIKYYIKYFVKHTYNTPYLRNIINGEPTPLLEVVSK